MPNEVLVAIGGFIGGGLITYLVGNYKSLTETDVTMVNDQIEQTWRIEGCAVDYWLADTKSSSENDKHLASLLNGAMTASSYFENDAERLMAHSYSKFKELDDDLFDLATGGDFQGHARDVDHDRVIQIISKCNEMRSFLRKTRRSIFGAR